MNYSLQPCIMRKSKLQKTIVKYSYLFYAGFFILYFLAQYYFLYHINGLQPFQLNIHFSSNVIGSFSKRFLVETAPYAFIFYLLFYVVHKNWKRIGLIAVFTIIFLINTLSIGYYFAAKTNFQLYVLEGFNWHVFLSLLTPGLTVALLAILIITTGLTFVLFKLHNGKNPIWPVKKYSFTVFLGLFAFFSPFLPMQYNNHVSVMNGDDLQKKTYKIITLENSGLQILLSELKFQFLPKKHTAYLLTEAEKGLAESKKLDLQITTDLPNPPKKIVVVVAESFNQTFLSRYNNQIPNVTPNLDEAFSKYAHIDDFYPSGPYSLHGLSAIFCGHTNLNRTKGDPDHICAPKHLAGAGYTTEFIRGASKYYVGENIHFKKFGFDSVFGKEDFVQKYPDFKKTHSRLYNTWGFTDDFVFNEGIERLKNSKPEDKLLLMLLAVDTHTPGGRCAYERSETDPEDPLLFSISCFDRTFNEFVKKLEKENLLTEDLAILLTSDHLYPAFNKIPGDDFQISFILKPAKIPFLMITKADISLKAKQGSQADIASTILDLANMDIPTSYMGKSLISNPYTNPVGQDIKNGYLMVENSFYPVSLNSSPQPFQKTKGSKSFRLELNTDDPDEFDMLVQQKKKEFEQDQNQEDAYFKWYYNKFFGL